MKKYLLLGLCLLGTAGQASETLVSPIEKPQTMETNDHPAGALCRIYKLHPAALEATRRTPQYTPGDPLDMPFPVAITNAEGETRIENALRLILPHYHSITEITALNSKDINPLYSIELYFPSNAKSTYAIIETFRDMQMYLKKGMRVTLNPQHDPLTKTISEQGNYVCTADLGDKETQVFHISIESGEITIPTHWRIENDPTPIAEPPLE